VKGSSFCLAPCEAHPLISVIAFLPIQAGYTHIVSSFKADSKHLALTAERPRPVHPVEFYAYFAGKIHSRQHSAPKPFYADGADDPLWVSKMPHGKR
jgi:hypothetical protein